MTIERRVRIVQDTDGCNPRTDWDCHVGRMLCWHSRYNLGDDHSYDSDNWKKELACEADADLEEWIDYMENDGWDCMYDFAVVLGGMNDTDAIAYASEKVVAAVDDRVDRAFDDSYVALLLSLYDHSGISMSTGRPSCPWDSGYVGVIVCDKETVEREFAGDRDRAEKALESEVEVYDQYLRGDVWGFIAEERCSEACTECSQCEDWNETDSCWGFFGSDPQTNGMADHLCNDYADAMADPVIEYA